MPLRKRDKRSVWVYSPAGLSEDVYAWENGEEILAAVYPLGDKLEEKPFGGSAKASRLMLYDGKKELSVGMGVSLDGGAPAWRIVGLEAWRHQRAVLESIPEGRRGDGRKDA